MFMDGRKQTEPRWKACGYGCNCSWMLEIHLDDCVSSWLSSCGRVELALLLALVLERFLPALANCGGGGQDGDHLVLVQDRLDVVGEEVIIGAAAELILVHG